MASEMNDEYREKILAQIPLGRLGSVTEVAEIACFLLSPSAAYITGQVIQPDGGVGNVGTKCHLPIKQRSSLTKAVMTVWIKLPCLSGAV